MTIRIILHIVTIMHRAVFISIMHNVFVAFSFIISIKITSKVLNINTIIFIAKTIVAVLK